MDFYEKLPTDLLMTFYHELMQNIDRGILTKDTYYELGLLISVASQRGITLGCEGNTDPFGVQMDPDDYLHL